MISSIVLSMFLFFVSASSPFFGEEPTYQVVLPEQDLTGFVRPFDSIALTFLRNEENTPLQDQAYGNGEVLDGVLALDGKVARRELFWVRHSRDSMAILRDSLERQIQGELGIQGGLEEDTLWDPGYEEWKCRRRWTWHCDRGTMVLETGWWWRDTTGNGKLFARMDSLVRTDPQDTLLARVSERIFSALGEPDDFHSVTLSIWNRLPSNAFGDALSRCLQTRKCRGSFGIQDSVGFDFLRIRLDGFPGHWLPRISDTASRRIVVDEDYPDWKVRGKIEAGILDSVAEFEIIHPNLMDCLNVWRQEQELLSGLMKKERHRAWLFEEYLAGLDSNRSPKTEAKLAQLEAMSRQRRIERKLHRMQGRFFERVHFSSISVRRRPIAVPWPLEDRDVTQRFRPRLRMRPPIPVFSNGEAISSLMERFGPYQEVVLLVDGKVQQRKLSLVDTSFYGWKSRDRVDSAFRYDLEELRSVFGPELEIQRDTVATPSLGDKPMVIETRIWRPDGGIVKIRRMEELNDTIEELAMLDRAVLKMFQAEPGLDSSRLLEQAAKSKERILEGGKSSASYQIFLSNPLEPDRFLQAMAHCVADSSCDPGGHSGVERVDEGEMVANSDLVPLTWFPERGQWVRSIGPIPYFFLPLRYRSDTLRSQLENGMEFERTSRSMVMPDFRLFASQMADSLRSPRWKRQVKRDEELSPLERFMIEEAEENIGRRSLAIGRGLTLSQELVVRRSPEHSVAKPRDP